MDVKSMLPRGIYRIVIAELGQIGPNVLAHQEGDRVTVLDRNVAPAPEQEWQVTPLENGNVTVTRPSKIIPPLALTYKGAPGPAREGEQIIQQVMEFPTEWQVGIAPGFRQTLRVAKTELGIAIAPPKIFPPILEVSRDRQLYWIFERIREE